MSAPGHIRKRNFAAIEELKEKHGIDYDSHASYRFVEDGIGGHEDMKSSCPLNQMFAAGENCSRADFLTGVALAMQVLVGLLFAPAAQGVQSFFGSKAGENRKVAGMDLCWCPPGRFRMGSPPDEPERRPGEDQVEVTLTTGFWMGKYEVTQGQWKQVIGKLPGQLTPEGGEGDDLPVYNVNYGESDGFCLKLTEIALASGEMPGDWVFRLPTEAQWEYACRAGTTTATSFGDKLSSKQANFQGRPYNGAEAGPSLKRAARVGNYPANSWGLHDMHGNVVEWCRDWYHAKLPGGRDPDMSSVKGTMNRDGTFSRSRRGSAWTDDGWASRSAFRQRFEPERRADHIGFRVALVLR